MNYAFKTFVFFGLLVSLSSAAELSTFKITTGHLSSSTPSPVSSPLSTPPLTLTPGDSMNAECATRTFDTCTANALCELEGTTCVGSSTFCTVEICATPSGAYCDGCPLQLQEDEVV